NKSSPRAAKENRRSCPFGGNIETVFSQKTNLRTKQFSKYVRTRKQKVTMNFLNKLKLHAHNYFLQKELSKHRVNHQSVDFENAETIGLLFDATQLSERETILRFAEKLKKQGKKVTLLGFVDDKVGHDGFPFSYFDKSQLDWALRPKSEAVRRFIETPFDILLNLCPAALPGLDYIAALSHAKFRVGPATEKIFCYELMVETAPSNNLQSFIDQVVSFITKMRTTHEPAS
ncbi:MAG: hypothetical protein D6714_15240, partial [Bacteroidetes bacterium]